MRQPAGPFIVSVFATPPLPRAGPVDFTVLLQASGSLTPVLDAQVEITARDQSGAVVSRNAFHSNAQNRLFYGAELTLPEEGQWKYEVSIRQAAANTKVGGSLQVFPGRSRLAAHWRAFSFPFGFILLFTLHQVLAHKPRTRAGVAT